MTPSDPYMDLNMSEVFDDWEQYEEALMEDIYRDPECRRELENAERILSAWDNDPEYEDLDDEMVKWVEDAVDDLGDDEYRVGWYIDEMPGFTVSQSEIDPDEDDDYAEGDDDWEDLEEDVDHRDWR